MKHTILSRQIPHPYYEGKLPCSLCPNV